MLEFRPFKKIPRLNRECIITEKIDGTNASIYIPAPGETLTKDEKLVPFLCGSRTRWIFPESDNHGFSKWAFSNVEELLKLGPGTHFGEWWGQKINRGYDQKEKHFSLFNTTRWTSETTPSCCRVVPIIYQGLFTTSAVNEALGELENRGSFAAPGYMKPEGIVIFHCAANNFYKVTIEDDELPKGALKDGKKVDE